MKTFKMNKVLIALDYDPTAQIVAEAGYSMAKTMNAEIILLHVISDPVYYSSVEYSPIMGLTDSIAIDPLQFNNTEKLKEVSKDFLENIKHHLRDEAIQTVLKDGDFAETILKTAKELHADVIVMGSHSRKWIENIVMGSVTDKVLRSTDTPLFIVPIKKHK